MDNVGEHDSAWRPQFYCAAQRAGDSGDDLFPRSEPLPVRATGSFTFLDSRDRLPTTAMPEGSPG
jgi:hypothetical protein